MCRYIGSYLHYDDILVAVLTYRKLPPLLCWYSGNYPPMQCIDLLVATSNVLIYIGSHHHCDDKLVATSTELGQMSKFDIDSYLYCVDIHILVATTTVMIYW